MLYTKTSRGRYRAARASEVLETAAQYRADKFIGTTLSNPRASVDFLREQLRHLEHEIFAVVYLDNRNRVLKYSPIFRGTVDGASVHPREVVKETLAENAAAVIFAHNHPSGIADPSQADEIITRRLKEALSLIDVRVLDHFIIAGNSHVSFAERGLL